MIGFADGLDFSVEGKGSKISGLSQCKNKIAFY